MVVRNRDLFVLQNDAGAMAFSLSGSPISFQPGQIVSVQGTEAAPYFESFPSYPYQPSGWDIRNTFEAPSNWGDYHLTRMRGYLHPPVTGDYTFWIASDNSSELWLSSDDEPAKATRIAFIKSGDWVNEHEWSRYPSQRSANINLSAGKTYYIEAVSEQLTLDENLAVAWQPPGFNQSIIDGRYLTPKVENREPTPFSRTNGVLREYWTNYTLGDLAGILGPKPFTSVFALKDAQVTVLGSGTWPESQKMRLDQPVLPENNYQWVETQGTITFVGINGSTAVLELTDNGRHVQVQVSRWQADNPERFQNRYVRVAGVCEGMETENGYLMPGLIWTPSNEEISFMESTNLDRASADIVAPNNFTEESLATNQIWSSYVSVRGVVTFNAQVFGRDFLFIQNDAAVVHISQKNHDFNQFQIGQWVEVGGTLIPGGFTPELNPALVKMLGWRPIPPPVTQPVEAPVEPSRNGQWTELEGVIRSISTNGTLVMMGEKGPVSVWIDRAPVESFNRYVDSVLRLRGVLSVENENDPILLVPSPNFVEVESAAQEDPFGISACYTSDINNAARENKWVHRVKIKGFATYRNGKYLFVQDVRGGVGVELASNNSAAHAGDEVEVVGFPENGKFSRTLTEAQVRVDRMNLALYPQKLDWTKAGSANYSDTLISLQAKILTQKTKGYDQTLELQEGQRFYEAVLASNLGQLPIFEPGSRLQIIGVLDVGHAGLAGGSDLSEPMRIFLRDPQDVVVLSGPPWWTWKGFVLLAGILLTVIIVGSLVIYVLRRNLERQRLAKLIFSRQILQSQEDERRRIAVNLHDTLGQNLLIIKNQSHLAMQLHADESMTRQRLKEISEVAIQAIEEVRQITRNLRPYQLDRLGLTHAIRAVIKQVSENCPIIFASHVDELDGSFDKESEIHIYRIIQESINNIIKHSGATEATIVIKKNTEMVLVSIRDNGRGFEAGLGEPVGFGLNSNLERVRIMGGKSKIDAPPGGGTSLIFEIPVIKRPNLEAK